MLISNKLGLIPLIKRARRSCSEFATQIKWLLTGHPVWTFVTLETREYCVRVSSSQSGPCPPRTKSLGAYPKHWRLMPDHGPGVRLAIFSVGFLPLLHVLARPSLEQLCIRFGHLARRLATISQLSFTNTASPVVSALPGASGAGCFSSQPISHPMYVPSLRLYLNGVRCWMCGFPSP